MFDKFTARNFMKQTSEKLQNSLDTSIAIGRNFFTKIMAYFKRHRLRRNMAILIVLCNSGSDILWKFQSYDKNFTLITSDYVKMVKNVHTLFSVFLSNIWVSVSYEKVFHSFHESLRKCQSKLLEFDYKMISTMNKNQGRI